MPYRAEFGRSQLAAQFPWSKEATSPRGWLETAVIQSIFPAPKTKPLRALRSLSVRSSILSLPPLAMVIAPHCSWTHPRTCSLTSKPELFLPPNPVLGACVPKMVPAMRLPVLHEVLSKPLASRSSTAAATKSPRLEAVVVLAPTSTPLYQLLQQQQALAMEAICRWLVSSTETRARGSSTALECFSKRHLAEARLTSALAASRFASIRPARPHNRSVVR